MIGITIACVFLGLLAAIQQFTISMQRRTIAIQAKTIKVQLSTIDAMHRIHDTQERTIDRLINIDATPHQAEIRSIN